MACAKKLQPQAARVLLTGQYLDGRLSSWRDPWVDVRKRECFLETPEELEEMSSPQCAVQFRSGSHDSILFRTLISYRAVLRLGSRSTLIATRRKPWKGDASLFGTSISAGPRPQTAGRRFCTVRRHARSTLPVSDSAFFARHSKEFSTFLTKITPGAPGLHSLGP